MAMLDDGTGECHGCHDANANRLNLIGRALQM